MTLQLQPAPLLPLFDDDGGSQLRRSLLHTDHLTLTSSSSLTCSTCSQPTISTLTISKRTHARRTATMIRCIFSIISLVAFLATINSSTAVPVAVSAAASISTASTTTTTVSPTAASSPSPRTSFLSSLSNHLKPKPQPKTLLSSVLSPYRFSFSHPAAAAALPPKKGTTITSTGKTLKSSSAQSPSTTTEKNWLLTKAWLIDNINRLRREMSELERDYSAHLDAAERANQAKDRQLIEDLTKLRADHTLLSQQQKQIIYLVKRAKLSSKGRTFSENDIQRSSPVYQLEKVADAPGSTTRRRSPVVKRAISDSGAERFQATTRHNMEEVFAELSALHDLTLTLFTDMRDMEHRIAIREKFQ